MILGISGKKQHGKDTIGRIIQCLVLEKDNPRYIEGLGGISKLVSSSGFNNLSINISSEWETKLFADKLKDIVCLLIGCTREQLEDNVFKESELGDEWACWCIPNGQFPRLFPIDVDIKWIAAGEPYFRRNMTPRMLLQLLGTECGRGIIHPNIWVNALMSEYKPTNQSAPGRMTVQYPSTSVDFQHNEAFDGPIEQYLIYPNWIITDVRFPNEAKPIKDRGGLVFRVVNPRVASTDKHASETSLDDYTEFDYTITNDGTMEELIEAVRLILVDAKII